MGTDLRYRTIYAMVPRAVIDTYLHEPWVVVIDAAERGQDGLSVQHGRTILWQGPQMGEPRVPNVAYLTNGQGGEWEEKTVLHQQNWTAL